MINKCSLQLSSRGDGDPEIYCRFGFIAINPGNSTEVTFERNTRKTIRFGKAHAEKSRSSKRACNYHIGKPSKIK